jgi:hypothetical protein
MIELHMGVIVASLVLAILALVLSWYSRLWLFLIFIPVFSIPILRATGLLKDIDERQKANGYRSSSIAFYFLVAFLLYNILNFGMYPQISQLIDPDQILLFLLVAVSIKYITGLVLNLTKYQAGIIVSLIACAWIIAFAIASHGIRFQPGHLVFELSLGLFALAATLIALRWPAVGGALLLAESVFIAIVSYIILERPFFAWITMSLPLLTSGFLFIKSAMESQIQEQE